MKHLTDNLLDAKNEVARNAAALLLAEVILNDATVLLWVRNTVAVTYPTTGGRLYSPKSFTCDAIDSGRPGYLESNSIKVDDTDRSLEQYMSQGISRECKFKGGTVKLTVVDSLLLDEAGTDQELVFDIVASPGRQGNWKVLELAGDDPSRMRFPGSRYVSQCAPDVVEHFGELPCGYQGITITGIVLSGADPVQIQATSNLGSTGSVFSIDGAAGITPSLDGVYQITWVSSNAFTLDGTASSDYAGTYTGGGTAGFADCPGQYEDCIERDNAERFGGCLGLANRGIVIALR